MPKIVLTNRAFDETVQRLGEHGEVIANPDAEPWSPDQLAALSRDADALMAFMPDRIDAAFLQACPRLRIVAAALKGYDNFDVEACTRHGVWLTIVNDLLTIPTAELAIGLMIAAGRNILPSDRSIRTGRFAGWRPTFYGTGLADAQVGIVGMGAVGRAIAERLGPFGAKTSYADQKPLSAGDEARLRVRRSDLDTLVSTSDFLVLALPLTPDTHHLIDRRRIAAMKPGALLINPSRGSVVDEAAVGEALEGGRLGAYAADVFEMEDWARTDRPGAIDSRIIAATDRTVLTPHLGSAVSATRRAIEKEAADSIIDLLSGRRPRGAVNDPRPRNHGAC